MFLLIKNKTLRGALGAIMPDLYFVSTTCAGNNSVNSTSGTMTTAFGERSNDELTTVEEIYIDYIFEFNMMIIEMI